MEVKVKSKSKKGTLGVTASWRLSAAAATALTAWRYSTKDSSSQGRVAAKVLHRLSGSGSPPAPVV